MNILGPKKKKKNHLSFIADLQKRFPNNESPQKSSKSLKEISLNCPESVPTKKKITAPSTDHSVCVEEGIADKMIILNEICIFPLKFWPGSDKSFDNGKYFRSQTQQKLITECIKNKDKWGMKSISREIEENTQQSIFEKKNESESKKSSIFHSEKIEEDKEENEEIGYHQTAGDHSILEKIKENSAEIKKSCSRSSSINKTVKSNRTHLSQKKDGTTPVEASMISETEKINYKEDEINKFMEKKNNLVRQKTLRQTYSKNSFFLFTLNSRFRKELIYVIESKYFQYAIRIFLAFNITVFMIKYYKEGPISSDDILFQISFYMELICNFFFLIEISIRIMAMGLILEKKTFLWEPFNILDFIVTIASFSQYLTIDYIRQPSKVLKMLRPFRFLASFEQLKKSIVALLDSLIFISKYLSTLMFLLIFFGILGLHLFKGVTENRCRETPLPINSTYWPAINNFDSLCGDLNCPTNSYCRNPSDYHIPPQAGEDQNGMLAFGLLNFNNFFSSCLTNLTFLTFTGWGMVTNIFWHAISPYVFAIFTLSQVFIVGLIYVNMVLAEFYESFVLSKSGQLRKEFRENSNDSKASQIFKSLKTAIENARKNQRRKSFYRRKSSRFPEMTAIKKLEEYMENESTNISGKQDIYIVFDLLIHNRFLKQFFNACTFLNLLLLICFSIFFFGNNQYDLIINNIDLVFSLIYILEILFSLIHYGPFAYWEKNSLQKFDLIICAFVFSGVILEIKNGVFFTASDYELKPFFMSIKLLRIFKMMVKSKLSFFKSIGKMINELIKSIMETGDYIIIIVIFLLVFSLVGLETLSCDEQCQAVEKETMVFHRFNYNSFWSSVSSTYLIFLNEEWHLFVLDYWNLKGWPYIIFFVVILIVCQLFIMKMFTALLINHFCRSANIKYLIKHTDDDKYFLPKFWKKKFRKLYHFILPYVDKIMNKILQKFKNCLKKEKNEIRVVSRQNEHLRKSIVNNRIKTMVSRKSVKIVEERNTVKFDEARLKKPEIDNNYENDDFSPTPPHDSRQKNRALTIARLEMELIKSSSSKLKEDSQKSKREEKDIKNNLPLNLGISQALSKDFRCESSNFEGAKNSSINNEGKKENEIKQLKTFNEKKTLQSALVATPKTNKSINSHSNTILQFSSILDSNNDVRSELNTAKIVKENEGVSLWLFPRDHKVRIFCKKLIKHPSFHLLILSLVITSCIFMAVKDPFSSPNSDINITVKNLEILFFVCFFIEFILKMISFGFLLNGPRSCLRQNENLLDFLLLILNIYEFTYDVSSNFKSLRMLKFFYIGPYRRSLKIVTKTLVHCFPNLIKIGIITVYVMFFFSFFAVKILKDRLYYCTNLSLNEISVQTRDECYDYGGDWIKKDYSYDNIADGLYTLFAICSTEGWIALSYDAIDARNINETPQVNTNRYWNVYYILYFTVSNLIIFNVLIGVLVEKYFHVKLKENKFHLLNEEQREWAHIRKSILKMKPMKKKKPPTKKLAGFLYKLSETKIYNIFFITCNLLNTFLYMLYWHRQEETVNNYLVDINYAFTVVFVLELALAILIKGANYFKSSWRLFDLSIIIYSFTIETISISGIIHVDPLLRSFSSITQVFRVLKIIGKIEFLKKIFITIKCILPQAANLLLLLIIFMVMYSLIGVELFAYLKPQQYVNGIDIHFKDFFFSFYSLMRVVTTDGWFTIVADCSRQMEPNFTCVPVNTYDDYLKNGLFGCGLTYAWVYFVTFDLIVVRIILNLFIAMLLAAAEEVVKIEKSSIGRYQLDKIKDLWLEYDPEGNGFISYKDFWIFSSQIAIIFGVDQGDLLNVENRTNFLKILEIPVYENTQEKIFCYKFHDVIVKLAKVSIILKYGVTDLEVFGEKKTAERNNKYCCMSFKKKKPNIFKETIYFSGDMAYLCRVLVGFRKWRQSASPSMGLKSKREANPEAFQNKQKIFDIKELIEKIKINIQLENEEENKQNSEVSENNTHTENNNTNPENGNIKIIHENDKIINESNENYNDESKNDNNNKNELSQNGKNSDHSSQQELHKKE